MGDQAFVVDSQKNRTNTSIFKINFPGLVGYLAMQTQMEFEMNQTINKRDQR